ncbi:MAG: TMEM175 family protein [Candidatus Azobacteroides sp.]|nr:TMEM175 family protein [Candidatus Azobacteroides sp.]
MTENNLEEKKQELEKHPKQDFQVERLAFFSDAVFAIAITLLIVEFKVPHITDTSTVDDVLKQLFNLKFNFIAILFSFFIIAVFWTDHHLLFKHIHNYNKQIIIANMFVLLPIIFFPFTTTFFAECDGTLNLDIMSLGLRFFSLNVFIAALAIYIFYRVAIIKYKDMSFKMATQDKIKFVSDSLFKMTFFAVIFIVTFIPNSPKFIFLPMLIVVVSYRLFRKRLKRKINNSEKK